MANNVNFKVLDMDLVEEKIANKVNKDKLRSNLLSAIAYWEKQIDNAKDIEA